jgi:hypothetical protein
MERLKYSPDELREAFRYASEQADFLLRSHAGNWRRAYTQFVEAMTLREEALKLLTRILDGHAGIDGRKWFEEAGQGRPPALPADRYGRLALGWKLVSLPVQKPGPDFDVGAQVDLSYVLSHGFAGGSLGEKYESFRLGYLVPFVEALRAFGEAIVAKLPEGGGPVDLWDAALAAF